MAAKKSTSAMDFILAYLKRNPKAAYSDVRTAAEKKNLTIYPIMYGRAQTLLGIVKMAPRGSKKKAKASRGPGRPRTIGRRGPGRPPKAGRRGPGRPRKNADPVDALQAIVAEYRESGRELERMRKVLESIRDLCDRAL